MEQLQSHIGLTASSYMGKYLCLPQVFTLVLWLPDLGTKDLILCNRGEMYCTVQYCTSIMVKSMPRSLKFPCSSFQNRSLDSGVSCYLTNLH